MCGELCCVLVMSRCGGGLVSSSYECVWVGGCGKFGAVLYCSYDIAVPGYRCDESFNYVAGTDAGV